MGFLSLFIVALMPVLKTLLVCAVGVVLALDRVNILGTVPRQNLNKIVFYVFAPSLVFSNLADTITANSIVSLWFMPINILLTFALGSVLGWILAKITRTPPQQEGLVISFCATGNLGFLLLIIIPAVCDEKNSPFGDSSTCSKIGKAYASFSMAVGAVFIWSYTYNVVRVYGSKSKSNTDVNESESGIEPSEGTSEGISGSCTEALLSKNSLNLEDCEAQAEPPQSESVDEVKVPFFKKINQGMGQFAKMINLKMVFAPSTAATIAGLFVGVVSPIRKIVIGSSAPLRVIENSATLVGEASIPSVTLIMGANLLRGMRRSELSLWVIIGTLVVRNIALPLLGVVVVKFARHIGIVGSDALYQFVLLLQYALPAAMGLGTMTQLFKYGERECAVLMLWNYALASISLTLWSTYFMWLVS